MEKTGVVYICKTEEATAPAVELVDIDDEIERERAGFASDSTARTPPR